MTFRLSAKRLLFGSFLIAFLVPLLFVSLGYWAAGSVVLDQATRYHSELLRHVATAVDGALQEFDTLSRTLTQTKWVQKIALMQGPTIDRTRLSVTDQAVFPGELETYRSLNRYVDRIVLLFNEKDLVVSATGFDTLDWFFSNAWTTPGTSPSAWKAKVQSWVPGELLPAVDLGQYGKTVRSLPYVRTIPVNFDASVKVTLLLAVNNDSIRKLMDSVTAIPGTAVLVTDATGTTITGDGESKVMDVLGGMHLEAGKVGSYQDSSGQSYYVFREQSSGNGWKYTAAIPMAVVMQRVNTVLAVSLAILFLAVLAGILAAVLLSRRNYQPIQAILDKIGPEVQGPEDEFARIDTALERSARIAAELRDQVAKYLPMAVHSFFLRLLYDAVEGEELAQAGSVIGITARQPVWTVAVVAREQRHEPLELSGSSHWVLEAEVPLYLVVIDTRRTALVLNSDDRQTMEAALNSFAPGAPAGIGTPRQGLESIRLSFREALATLDFALFRGSEGVVHFTDQAVARPAEFHYPPAAEEELLGLTRHGDFALVKTCLDTLVERNSVAIGSSFIARQCFIYNLLSTALKAASGTGLQLRDVAREFRLIDAQSPGAMLESVYASFETVCRAMIARREGHAQRQRDAILQSIDAQALSSSISLSSIAGEFGVSVPYLSRFIKDKTGENFIDYLTRKRITRAKELLLEGGRTIEDVSRNVGYINALTFRRAFKRLEGVNPGDWRQTEEASSAPVVREDALHNDLFSD